MGFLALRSNPVILWLLCKRCSKRDSSFKVGKAFNDMFKKELVLKNWCYCHCSMVLLGFYFGDLVVQL